jgi:MoaA/NifB/PqqE/SkfB family radical SAM enzyme
MLGAPLYAAWQLTNRCDLACRHCIEESGPGAAWPGELGREEALSVLAKLAGAQIPFLAFSGGEPLLCPHFWDLASRAASLGMEVKVETNAQSLTRADCRRFKSLGVKSVQVSLDGASPAAYEDLRPSGSWEKAVEGLRLLSECGVESEANFSPTRANALEIGPAMDLAASLGVSSFYTGRTMHAGRAVANWGRLDCGEEAYRAFFETVRRKAEEHRGRMRVCFHEMGLASELRSRLGSPAALFILLPDGRVKLVNALPFVCGDLRRQEVGEVWEAFLRAWSSPEVERFVRDLLSDPSRLARMHDLVDLSCARAP